MWVDTLHSFYILTSPAVVRLLCPKKKKNPAILAGKPGMIAQVSIQFTSMYLQKNYETKTKKGIQYGIPAY